jgi:hypothetical protein
MAGPPRDCRTSAMARPARFRYAQSQRLMRTPRSLTTAHAAGRRLAAKIVLASATSCSSMSRRRCYGSPRTYEPVKVQAVEATKIGGVQGSLETDRSSNGTFSTATGGGELAEALGVVDALAADQADARAVLQREHAPAVVLLFVDPAKAVKQRTDERGLHGNHARPHKASIRSRQATVRG